MQFTAAQIASLINGKVEGNPEAVVDKVAKIEEATRGALCFLANPKYEDHIYTTEASVIIVSNGFEPKAPLHCTLIRVADAYSGFALLLEKYNEIIAGSRKKGIEDNAHISATARLGNDVYIGSFSYIGDNAVIGDNVQVYPGCYIGDNAVIKRDTVLNAGVCIYRDCIIGEKVIIHSGTVIGSDGFGFAPQQDNSYKKIPQIGNVIIEDNVEIGANCSIDRATMGSTIIRKGVKLDNLIQVAHNVEVGENTVIAAQAGISGSTKVGRNCIIGGQAGIVGHIQLADGTRINAQSGLSKSVTTPNTALTGSPAYDYKSSLKSQAIFRNLPEIHQRLQKLEEMMQELMEAMNNKNTAF
jgi:UDP-3-O-[3-hydroxymyristoyl] glucosamine N-acyltransferase